MAGPGVRIQCRGKSRHAKEKRPIHKCHPHSQGRRLRQASKDKNLREGGPERQARKSTGRLRKIPGLADNYFPKSSPSRSQSSPGTWVPLPEGRLLAERNGVFDKLRPIFDFVPGDSSPPPAPKHTTNSNKPKIPKAPNNKKIPSQ